MKCRIRLTVLLQFSLFFPPKYKKFFRTLCLFGSLAFGKKEEMTQFWNSAFCDLTKGSGTNAKLVTTPPSRCWFALVFTTFTAVEGDKNKGALALAKS